MNLNTKLIPLLLFFILNSLHARQNLKRCTLLPVIDDVAGAMGFEIYRNVENYLQGSQWCLYKSNSGLMNIFSRYRNNLNEHLENQDVRKIISERLKVGTLIKIKLTNEINGTDVEVKIFGGDGEDLYIEENFLEKNKDLKIITQKIVAQIEIYAKNLPYQGLVTGVLGDQITIDIGKKANYQIGDALQIIRPTRPKKHPLLERIVEWESKKLAEGQLFNISENQILGTIKTYFGEERLRVGDWVLIDRTMFSDKSNRLKYPDIKASQFGKLGEARLLLDLSSLSMNTSTNSQPKKVSGFVPGIEAGLDLWITRNFFALASLGTKFGNLKQKEGTLESDSVGISKNHLKLGGGYKLLPLGFFYGPQVDFFLAYARHGFDSDYQQTDGFGTLSISGVTVGLNGNIPLMRDFRAEIGAEILTFGSFSEDTNLYGSADGVSSLLFKIGGIYQYNSYLNIYTTFSSANYKARFNDGLFREIKFQDSSLRFGIGYIF